MIFLKLERTQAFQNYNKTSPVGDIKSQDVLEEHSLHSGLILLSVHTSGLIVGFLPVQDDEGGATFHRHHGEVGGRRLGWRSHVGLSGFIFGEVVERRGDGARLVRFLARLVDDVRGFGRGEH